MKRICSEFIEFYLPLVMMIALLFGLLFGVLYQLEVKACRNYQNITGRATEYMFCGGCFVKSESGWMTKDEYSQIIVAREGLLSRRIEE